MEIDYIEVLKIVGIVLGSTIPALLTYFSLKNKSQDDLNLAVTSKVQEAQTDIRTYLTEQLDIMTTRNAECESEREKDRKAHSIEREENEVRYRGLIREQTRLIESLEKMKRTLAQYNITVPNGN